MRLDEATVRALVADAQAALDSPWPDGDRENGLAEAVQNLAADWLAMRALLSEVEWLWDDEESAYRCEFCGGSKDEGHKLDCRLDAALKEGR